MKKIYSILFAATALFAASCQKEISNPEIDAPKGEVMTITATTDAETKTTLNGMATLWAASDQISVFDSNKGANNRCFEINDECDGEETATFSYEGEFVMPQNGQTDPTVVALYPYQANAYCDFFYYDHADITSLNIEAEQTAVEDGFDADATFAIALGTLSTKDELKFSNLYSLLKFTVLDAGVKEVTVTVEGEDAFIAGDARIDLTINLEAGAGKPVFENPVLSATTSKTVTLSCEGGFEKGKTYYIAVAPTSYTGISVALDGTTVKTSNNAKTLEKNKVYNLGDLEYVEPDPITINLVPGQWVSDGAWFAVAYNNGVHKMTIDDDGYYTYELPGNVEAFAFWRMNPASEDLTEANRWNEIPNVAVPTDENNYYIWSSWNAPFGAWGPKPAEKTFGIVGEFDWDNDIPMGKVASGVYAAKNVTQIAPFTKWKIRVNGGWDESYTSAITGIEANKWVAIGGSGDLTHAVDGAIDIYIDINQSRIYVMSAGTDYSTAVQQTVSTTPPPAGIPAKENYLYLNPSMWAVDGARFAAYFFGNGEKWVSMTDPDSDGIYEVEKQAGYTKVIFCRMNGSNSTNGWSNKWNQSGDLTIPTDGKNLFTPSDWDGATTTWTTVTEF